MIYLDNAATTLHKPPAVGRAVQQALARCGGAGRGGHKAAMRSAEILLDCREEAAGLLGVSEPERVIFTSNATHALNIAIASAVPPQGRVITSGLEHNAVMRPLEELKTRGLTVQTLPTPLFEPEMAFHQFEAALERGADCVICTHVSNVFGYILPIERIGALCEARNIPFIVDASQSAGCLPIDADRLPHAWWGMPGHKGLYGPQGTGLLIVPSGAEAKPLLFGGTGSRSIEALMPDVLPDRLEAGTHNTHGVAGLLEGIRHVRARGVERILRKERIFTGQLVGALAGRRRVRVYAANHLFCQTGVVSYTVEGANSECVAEMLGHEDIAVRAGLHCAPAAHRTADTLPGGTVRVSFSDFNTPRDVNAFIQAMEKIL